MANLARVHESCLPSEKRARRKLIEDIRRVAIEIEFEGRGDVTVLARELDSRGVKSVRGIGWFSEGLHGNFNANNLTGFIKRHLPDLWPNGVKSSTESEPQCLCSQCEVNRQSSCERFHSQEVPLANEALDSPRLDNAVRQRAVSKLSNPVSNERRTLDGWTIRQDNHGYYRAYRKINGKLKSVYMGKSLDGAQDKIAKAVEMDQGRRP